MDLFDRPWPRRVARIAWIMLPGLLAVLLSSSPSWAALSPESKTRRLEFPDRQSVTVKCDGDRRVGFGGFKLDTEVPFQSGPTAFPDGMAPRGDRIDRWSTTAHNDSVTHDARQTSSVYCFDGRKPRVRTATESVPPASGSINDLHEITVGCPQRTKLSGGGWRSDAEEVTTLGFERAPGTQTLLLTVINGNSVAVNVTAIAICRPGRSPSAHENTVDVHENDTEGASAVGVCPSGKQVVFGGYRAEYDAGDGRIALPIAFQRPTARRIRVTAVHPPLPPGSGDTAGLTAIAYCR